MSHKSDNVVYLFPVPPRTPMDGATMIEQFLNWQTGVCSWSPATVRRRSKTLRAFAAHVAPAELADATLADVESFLAARPSASTRHAYRSDLRVFYAWALERGHVDHDPAEKVGKVKVSKRGPRPIQYEQLVAAMSAARPAMQARLALGALAGLRCAEIAALDVEHIDFAGLTIQVREGKGGKDRTVNMNPALVPYLERWRHKSGPLFPGQCGERVTAAAMSASIGRHLSSCGINATAHQLRHLFGTELTRATAGDLVTVGKEMGHGSTTTTAIYAGWSGQGAEAVGRMFRDGPPLPPAA